MFFWQRFWSRHTVTMNGLRPIALGMVLIVAVAGCNIPRRPVTSDATPAADYGPAPNFELPNVAGGMFELRNQTAAHRAVILTFVAADCREACPKVEAVLRTAAQSLQARHALGRSVEIATVELDPRTNTLQAVRALRKKVWPHAGWAFLRGSPAQTKLALRAYDAYAAPRKPGKDIEHSSYVYVIDDRMRQIDLLAPGVNLTPAMVVSAADAAVSHHAPPSVAVGGR